MRGVLIERYDSRSSDEGGGSAMLEDVPESIQEDVDAAPGVHDAILLLRTPVTEHSAAAIDYALARMLHAGSKFTVADSLAVSSDLRDLPRLDPAGMRQQHEKVLSQCEAIRAQGLDANALERRADEAISSLAGTRARRVELIERVRSARGESVANELARWSDYLAMNADTNEYPASAARGEGFVRLALRDFPRQMRRSAAAMTR